MIARVFGRVRHYLAVAILSTSVASLGPALAAGQNQAAVVHQQEHERYLAIEKLIASHSYIPAREALAALKRTSSNKSEVLLASADLDRAMGLFSKALSEYQQLVVEAPALNEPILALAEMYIEYMNPREALAMARRAVAREPDSRKARVTLCQSLILSGYLKEADEELAKLNKEFPNDADVDYVAYRLARERGRLGQARRCLEQAIRLKPGEQKWQLSLSDLSQLQGDYNESLRCLDLVIAQEPFNVDAMEKRAVLLEFYLQDFDLAVQQYKKILEIDPDSVTALAGIDRCKVRSNDVAGAFKFQIRKAVAGVWNVFFPKPFN
ncbi:MAG TPA: tetratricopeptide repeat protein [Chroococcales cyanobacterium]